MSEVVANLDSNIAYPSWFDVGGPSNALRAISIAVLIPGVASRRSEGPQLGHAPIESLRFESGFGA
jgi:hypothetical protein